jgi:hypothetical protein
MAMAMAMANNTSNGNNANNTNNANATNNANPGKQTTAAKDSSKEEELEEMLYRLDQAHAQVSLPWQSNQAITHCHNAVGNDLSDCNAASAASLGASAHVGAAQDQTPIA